MASNIFMTTEDEIELLTQEIKNLVPLPIIAGIEGADRLILDDGIEGVLADFMPIVWRARVRKSIVFVIIILSLVSFGGPIAISVIIMLVIMRSFRKRKRKKK